MVFVGIEIGGSKIQSAIVDRRGHVLAAASGRAPTAGGADAILGLLGDQIGRLRRDWNDREPIAAAGIGFGGPVHRDAGRVVASFHVGGWDGFPLVEWTSHRLGGLPTVLENDTNAAALAEAVLGAGRGMRVVVYSNCGSGIGGGLVIDGRVYHGGGVTEMEVGHLRLGDGRRTTEELASGWSIDRRVRDEVTRDPGGMLASLAAGEPADARLLAKAVAAGDASASGILDEAAMHYATALSHVVHLLSPQVIVLGGGVAELGEAWRMRVAGQLATSIMRPMQPGPDVRLAALGQNVVPIGAALVAASTVAG